MDPVNGPWIILIRSVSVGYTGRKDKVLVCFYIIALVIDFKPTFSIDTIYKYILVYGFLSAAVVMPCFGIVTDIRNIDRGRERVIFHKFDYSLRQYNRLFAFESVSDFHNT